MENNKFSTGKGFCNGFHQAEDFSGNMEKIRQACINECEQHLDEVVDQLKELGADITCDCGKPTTDCKLCSCQASE